MKWPCWLIGHCWQWSEQEVKHRYRVISGDQVETREKSIWKMKGLCLRCGWVKFKDVEGL